MFPHTLQHKQQQHGGQSEDSVAYPGLSDVEEGVVHLEEELPGDFLQSQLVLDLSKATCDAGSGGEAFNDRAGDEVQQEPWGGSPATSA